MKVDEEKIKAFHTELAQLVDKNINSLPIYELINGLIGVGVAISLKAAPNELLGFQTIFASIENGIKIYYRSSEKEINPYEGVGKVFGDLLSE